MKIKYKKLHPNAVLPKSGKLGDAGVDLTATEVTRDEFDNIHYGFGLSVEIPEGYVGLMFARSSIREFKQMPTNCVGVIDSGYRGELKMVMQEVVPTNYVVLRSDKRKKMYNVGDRVCQLVIVPFYPQEPEWAEYLSETERGATGYGSTGQ